MFPNLSASEKTYENIEFTIPFGGKKLLINSNGNTKTRLYKLGNIDVNPSGIKYLNSNFVKKEYLDDRIANLFKEVFTNEESLTWIEGSYYQYSTGNIVANEGTKRTSVNVEQGETYKITGASHWECNLILFMDKYEKIIDKFPNTNETGKVYNDHVFTIPKNCVKLLINEKTSLATTRLYKCSGYTLIESDKLALNWCAFGDSLTDSVTLSGAKNYVNFVSESLGLNVTNCGKAGTGYVANNNGYGKPFYQRVDTIPTNTDILTVFGSFNDVAQYEFNLGTIKDTEPTTIYGSIKKFIENAMLRNPSMVIAIISPTPWSGRWLGATEDRAKRCVEYTQALKDVAEYYSLPYLDLFRCSNLRPWEEWFNAQYFKDGDGTHPNELGHKKYIAPKIEHFIKSIVKNY